MRLHLSDSALVPDLVDYLESVPDVVVEVLSDEDVEVALLGSYALDAMRMELTLRIRAWEAARGARGLVEVVEVP
jgi:hypothetical protein